VVTKSCAGIVACAIAAFALTVATANGQPVDSQTAVSGSDSSGTSGSSGSSGSGSGTSGSGSTDAGSVSSSSGTGYPDPTATFAPTDSSQPATTTTPTDSTATAPASTDPAAATNDQDGSDDTDSSPTNPSPTPVTATPAPPGPRFLIRARSAVIDDLISRHRGTQIVVVHETVATDPTANERVVLIAGPEDITPDAFDQEMDADPDVLGCERDRSLALPELAGAALSSSIGSIADGLATQTVRPFFGADAPSTYTAQPATSIINLPLVRGSYTGGGIVAVIDTGVDASHPVLGNAVMPGYDFTREQAGTATDLLDIDQSTAAILEQSTAAILEQNSVVVLNQSTAAILEQSTAAILEGLPPLPTAFGHGTMVAGLVHLTAPTATIMPVKAFTADGTSTVALVVRAIYYAVDNGARVINMSFSIADSSPELLKAINYATSRRVTCVASAGNLGVETVVYPAAYRNVVSVASTNNLDQRSVFSNYGDADVTIAAPGEGLTTTFPGGHFANVSGTSFSAAFVSGAVALMIPNAPSLTPRDALDNLTNAAKITPRIGYGRLDLAKALPKDHD
jgi:subtilase family protein